MAIEVELLPQEVFMQMMDETRPRHEREAAMQQFALWTERVREAIFELQQRLAAE